MRTRAAVMRQRGGPLAVETIELDPPGPGEVQLRMTAAGICGSDLHVLDGYFPAPLPSVCGHEGAGVVEAIGDGVTGIDVGDHVVQTFVGPCGDCPTCRAGRGTFCRVPGSVNGRLLDGEFRMRDAKGEDLATTLGLGSFSAHTVSPARNCVVIPPDVDLRSAALVSCGVSTGVGAALNVAGVRPASSAAVIGLGGVGAAAVLGCVIGGAGRVVAIDIKEAKREIAYELGATDFLNPETDDVRRELLALTDGQGVDSVLLTADQVRSDQYELAMKSLAPGGVTVQVGATESGLDHLPVAPPVFTGRQASFTGTVLGGMDPRADVPRWVELYRTGRLPLERLITHTYGLADINDAFADCAAGRNTRGVIVYE